MRERPSTAETRTGTSNSASRSAAVLLWDSGSPGASARSPGGKAPFSRFGNGTLEGLSLMVAAFQLRMPGRAPPFHKSLNCLADHGVGGRAVARHAAIGPFDPAIANRDIRLRQH